MGKVFEVAAKHVMVPIGATPNDFLFHGKEERFVESNHLDQVVVVEAEDKVPIAMTYDAIKNGLRVNYAGRTIFPIVHNVNAECRHFGRCEERDIWLVAVYGSGVKAKTYFYGDAMQQDAQPDAKKIVRAVQVPCVDERGKMIDAWYVPKDQDEYDDFVKHIDENVDAKMIIKGMEMWLLRKKTVERAIFVSKVEFVEETYEWLVPVIQKVKKLDDVVVWRDLVADAAIPSEMEGFILTSALFFSYEGYAAINLLLIGQPGKGKSFQLDVFAYLMGTMCHNMAESTPKGLVYSHSTRGSDDLAGKPGILYRERDVALLNEFMRLIGDTKMHASANDEARRVLSALNDAVEKKKNRSRSSGNVTATGTVVCSIMTSDNDYDAVLRPFMKAMMDDASYIRRYAYLRISKDTELRGAKGARPANWRKALDALLLRKGLSVIAWRGLMRYWRKLIPRAMESIASSQFADVRDYAAQEYRRAALEAAGLTELDLLDTSSMAPTFARVLEGDMRQNAEALLICAVIMNATFKADGLVERFECGVEQVDFSKGAMLRLIEDFMRDLKPLLQEEMIRERGVRRI